MSIVTIVANGDSPPPREIQIHAEQSEHIIAVDGGADHCLLLGLSPTLVIGDLDSISDEAKEKFKGSAQFQEAPTDKDEMDLELALQVAVQLGAEQILVFGWSSADANYTYGNLRIASRCPIPLILINEKGWNTFLSEECGGVDVHASDGTKKVSVFPFSPDVSLKSLGLKWELEWEKVDLDTISQSNELREETATIALTEGVAWVSVERPFV